MLIAVLLQLFCSSFFNSAILYKCATPMKPHSSNQPGSKSFLPHCQLSIINYQLFKIWDVEVVEQPVAPPVDVKVTAVVPVVVATG